jgi:hypothetical protein
MPGAVAPIAPRAKIKSTRISPLQVHRTSQHSLRDGFNGVLRARPGDRAFCLRPRRDAKHHRQVDISVGISGPHDFAVRKTRARQSRISRPSHPAPNTRDDREAPSLEGRGIGESVHLICPTRQAKRLRHDGTTGKSGAAMEIVSSDCVTPVPIPSSLRERNCAHRWRCEPCGALAPLGEPRRMTGHRSCHASLEAYTSATHPSRRRFAPPQDDVTSQAASLEG